MFLCGWLARCAMFPASVFLTGGADVIEFLIQFVTNGCFHSSMHWRVTLPVATRARHTVYIHEHFGG